MPPANSNPTHLHLLEVERHGLKHEAEVVAVVEGVQQPDAVVPEGKGRGG